MDKNTSEIFDSIVSIEEGIHRTERVLLFDSLWEMLSCYINGKDDGRTMFPMSRLKEVFAEYNIPGTERHRYQYHGGDHGTISGFFSFTDTMVYVYRKDDHNCIASISPYNMAHFLCDFFDNEAECKSLKEWVDGNVFWQDTVTEAIENEVYKS